MPVKVLNIKVCSPFKLFSDLIGNYHVICHYSYNHRWATAMLNRIITLNNRKMKKLKNLTIYLFTLLILISCSNDDENGSSTSETIKQKKVTVAEVGSSPYSMNFEYNVTSLLKSLSPLEE